MSLEGGSAGYSVNMGPEMAGQLQKIPTWTSWPRHIALSLTLKPDATKYTLGIKHLTPFSDYSHLHSSSCLYAAQTTGVVFSFKWIHHNIACASYPLWPSPFSCSCSFIVPFKLFSPLYFLFPPLPRMYFLFFCMSFFFLIFLSNTLLPCLER